MAQATVLSLLYSVAAVWVMRYFISVADNDIWWHLAAGKWILQHKSILRADPFSAYGMGKPWAAYSWAFEAAAAWLVTHLGLMGLLLLNCVLVTAVMVALHRLIMSLVHDFTISALLTLAAGFAMHRLFTPRPWLFTILFFVLELHIVLEVRQGGNYRQLRWLPFILCAWANLHILFVYGLFLLVLAAGEAWLNWSHARYDLLQRDARNAWTATVIVCTVATLLNPFFVGIYTLVYQLATQTGMMNLVSELRAIPFRTVSDYLLVLIGIVAIGMLAWSRERRPFLWVLLLWAVLFSFRSQRDLWLMAVVGTATVATSLRGKATVKFQSSKLQSCCIAIAVALVSFCVCRLSGLSSEKLEQATAMKFPAAAVEAVKAKGLAGPLFNDYGWGGYLIWSLPELPVSMDGRQNLHGTPRIERSVFTWAARRDWNDDQELQNARLVIGQVDAPLCAVLRLDPRYELVYEDKVASVFVKRDAR
jgi:hypothetical protein